MEPFVIALNGVRGSGKDTVGRLLHEAYGFGMTSFAAPLKQMAQIAFPFSDEQLHGPTLMREVMLPEFPFTGPCLKCGESLLLHDGPDGSYWPGVDGAPPTPSNEHYVCTKCGEKYPVCINARLALKSLGTEWGRRLFKNIWVAAALANIRTSTQRLGTNRWVITDCRFPNEIDAVRRQGGIVVRLLRKWDDDIGETHASETEMKTVPHDRVDFLLDNRGPLSELPHLVDDMMKRFSFLL